MDRIFSFPPVVQADARVLILGSMPGVASLQAHRYYAHPHNQFWPIMGNILGFDPQAPYEERCTLVRQAGIAIWDVLQSCVRTGSLDVAIETSTTMPNDLSGLVATLPRLRCICFNGGTAQVLFRRHIVPKLQNRAGLQWVRLPSTSPAHAGMRREAKLEAWSAALGTYLQDKD